MKDGVVHDDILTLEPYFVPFSKYFLLFYLLFVWLLSFLGAGVVVVVVVESAQKFSEFILCSGILLDSAEWGGHI